MEIITSAGLDPIGGAEPAPVDPRRESLKAIRAVLRRADASDAEYDDALEALTLLRGE